MEFEVKRIADMTAPPITPASISDPKMKNIRPSSAA